MIKDVQYSKKLKKEHHLKILLIKLVKILQLYLKKLNYIVMQKNLDPLEKVVV